MMFDESKIPNELRTIVKFAEKWGIGDDYDRSTLVEEASQTEREELINCIPEELDKALFEWLCGPESYSKNPSDEYLAFTNLTLAIEYAKALNKSKV